jgi:quinohemoprotein ethanol dehydrogenase
MALGLAAGLAIRMTHKPTALPARSMAIVDQQRLDGAAGEPENWFTGGRDKNGTYYSPLKLINAGNVTRLGFAWQYVLDGGRGQEATPIVVDGVMYTSGSWGYVYALDAATGHELWRFDPMANYPAARHPCCDMVNRGVAVWKARVYVASVDGRLHALDARSGQKLWEVDTITDHSLPYSSSGAPQVAGTVVVIGNSGADMGRGGVRGYVSAYDLDDGALKWRFYTVPPARGQPYENPELEWADKTWDPARASQYKGGGTVWDGFAYDAQLNLVYFGTGNAAPYDQRLLGPTQPDALYTASILAVHADTGRLAWHYQTTPRDSWDFDSTQKMVLAQIPVNGAQRSVLMQACKNGYYYVIDRATGELLSAKNYTYVNWSSGVDIKTGRPLLTEQSNWYTGPKNIYPSWAGGHTWMPMSYSLASRLVYIPVIDVPNIWVDMMANGGSVKFLDGFFTVNGIMPDDFYDPAALRRLYGPLPTLKSIRATRPEKLVREVLRAWDPEKQQVVWEHETSGGVRGYDGGVLSTGGSLVVQGRGSGELWVYAADTGAVLKVLQTGSHIMAAPMSYAVGGVQYLAVQAGYGGAAITVGSIPASSAALKYQNTNRIIAFRLDGGTVPTPALRPENPFVNPPEQNSSAALVRTGEILFIQECSRCHAFGPSVTPDLRKLDGGLHAAFKDILLKGAMAPTGMESFADLLSAADVDAIHAYVVDEGWKGFRAQQSALAHH